MKSWTGGDAAAFAPYEQRLAAVSRKFDGLPSVMQRFWASSAQIPGSARTVQARIWRAAAPVETPYVLTALEGLESLIARHYDALDGPTKARVEAHYLQTLELTLEEADAHLAEVLARSSCGEQWKALKSVKDFAATPAGVQVLYDLLWEDLQAAFNSRTWIVPSEPSPGGADFLEHG